MSYYIGVRGNPFKLKDRDQLKQLVETGIQEAILRREELEDLDFDDTVYIVSGLIVKGIVKFAYDYADEMGYDKIGIDSTLAKNYDQAYRDFYTKYVDGNFGSENEIFLRNVDILIVVEGREHDEELATLAKSKNIPVLVMSQDAADEVENDSRQRKSKRR